MCSDQVRKIYSERNLKIWHEIDKVYKSDHSEKTISSALRETIYDESFAPENVWILRLVVLIVQIEVCDEKKPTGGIREHGRKEQY